MNEHITRVQQGEGGGGSMGGEVAKKLNKILNLNNPTERVSFHRQMFPKSQCLNNHFLMIHSLEF